MPRQSNLGRPRAGEAEAAAAAAAAAGRRGSASYSWFSPFVRLSFVRSFVSRSVLHLAVGLRGPLLRLDDALRGLLEEHGVAGGLGRGRLAGVL